MSPSFRSALLLAAVATASVAGADQPAAAPSLNVAVRGAPAAPIAAAIADELAVPVALADGAACAAPCVSIAIGADRTAAIAVALVDGAIARTIALPADDAAAAEIVALIVGNLARDEAAGLLAALTPAVAAPADAPGLPAPAVPAPPSASTDAAPPTTDADPGVTPPPPTTPGATRERPATGFSLGLIPPLAVEASSRHPGVAVDLVIGLRRRLHAFNVSAVASLVREDVRGTQIAGALAIAHEVRGTQIGGAITVAHELSGTQIAGAAAIAKRVDGTQIAGAVTAADHVRGTQIAGAATVAKRVDGTQLAGAVAHTRGDARGVQVAGAVTIAGGTVDTQVAGAVAIARRVRGLQVAGAVNIADQVDGVQVGVVNVARGGDGISIGLFNLVAGGRTDVEATVDTDALGAVLLRHGSRRWHNAYGVAGRATAATFDRALDDDEPVALGLGMGPTWRRDATSLDVELMAWNVLFGGRLGDDVNVLGQLRATVSHRIGPIAIVGGAAINTFVTTDPNRDRLERARMPVVDPGVRAAVWPTAFVGLRL